MTNYTADDPPPINTHVWINDTTLSMIPRITGWVIGHGHQDTGPRGPIVLVTLDTNWQRLFTGPCTVSCLPIRPEFLAPVTQDQP